MMKTIPFAIVSLLLFLGFQVERVHAALIVTTSQQKPLEHVFFSIEASTSTSGVIVQHSIRASDPFKALNTQGQTFSLAQETQLKTVVFRLPSAGAIQSGVLGTQFELTFYEMESADSSEPTSEVIRLSGTLPLTLAPNDYLYINLETPLSLDAGQQYGVVLSFPELKANQGLSLMTGLSSHTGGKRISYVVNASGEGWATGNNGHLSIHLVTIPEPGSMALLLGLGAPLALVALRYRRLV